MVEDLLVASRIEAGRFSINWQTFSLNQILDEVLIQMNAKRREKEISLEVISNPEISLMGDGKRIGQVLRILIDNAIKFSSRESKVILRVEDNYKGVYSKSSKVGVLIQVVDSGRGILDKDLPFIFERYFRSEDIADIPGSGVGLSIAKTIIEEHNGNICVESEYGTGSTFSVFLPRISEIKEIISEKKWKTKREA
jgi:signal transduction histidine kinase